MPKLIWLTCVFYSCDSVDDTASAFHLTNIDGFPVAKKNECFPNVFITLGSVAFVMAKSKPCKVFRFLDFSTAQFRHAD